MKSSRSPKSDSHADEREPVPGFLSSRLCCQWQYHIVATNTTICGLANFVSHIPGANLQAYDNSYSAENPFSFTA